MIVILLTGIHNRQLANFWQRTSTTDWCVAPVFVTSVMKFDVLSFGENSEAEFIETQVFAASSNRRASAAGVAAASPPHTCRWESVSNGLLKHHSGEQRPVGELMFLSNSTVLLRPAPSLWRHPQPKKGGMNRKRNDSTVGGDFSRLWCLSAQSTDFMFLQGGT